MDNYNCIIEANSHKKEKKKKNVEFVRNLLGRQVQVQLLEDQKSHKINFIAGIQIVSYVLHCI